MRKIMDLRDDITMDDLARLSDMFEHPIAVKLRKNLELWLDDEVSFLSYHLVSPLNFLVHKKQNPKHRIERWGLFGAVELENKEGDLI